MLNATKMYEYETNKLGNSVGGNYLTEYIFHKFKHDTVRIFYNIVYKLLIYFNLIFLKLVKKRDENVTIL